MARIVRETDTGYRKKSIDRIRSRIRLYGNELPPWHTSGQKIHDPAGPSGCRNGITLFDTAEYGPFINEELTGEALAPSGTGSPSAPNSASNMRKESKPD